MQLNFIGSVLFVDDINVSKNFYQNVLGQEIEMDHGPCVAFKKGLSIWERTHVEQIINNGQPLPEGRFGRQNLEIYFETFDLDRDLKALLEANLTFVHDVETAPWGQRAVRIEDPDGHYIEIGEHLGVVINRFRGEGMNDEAVADRMAIPLEAVRFLGAMNG